MPSILSRYLPADSPALRREFEISCADEIEALYTRFRAQKAIERLEAKKPGILTISVEQLNLPSRTVTALKGKFYDTVADLLPFTKEDLAKVPGLSQESAQIVLEAVNSLITHNPKR